MARLSQENEVLREQVKTLSPASGTYNGLTFEEMYKLLNTAKIDIADLKEEIARNLQEIADIFGDAEPGLIHIFWMLSEEFQRGQQLDLDLAKLALNLENFGLVEGTIKNPRIFRITESGRQFFLRLMVERDTQKQKSLP